MRSKFMLATASLALALAACKVTVKDGDQAGNSDQQVTADQNAAAPQPVPGQGDSNPQSIARARELALTLGNDAQCQQGRQQAQAQLQNVRFEVDISDRKLRIFNGDQLIQTQDVAVGTQKWPTPTGSWEFHRVDLNPEWNPPKDEEWAEEREPKAPGAADNPMGRARLVYRMPNTIHGTDDTASLGKASSHGSIRVANPVVVQLAELLLKAGGAWEGPQWFQRMTQDRTQEYQIDLPRHIPIKVQE